MKKKISNVCLLTVMALFIAGCASQKKEAFTPAKLSELTYEQISSTINGGAPFEAMQDISALQRENNVGLSAPELNELYEKAVQKTEMLFEEAVESAQYRKALSIYRSGAAIGIAEERFGEWEEQDFYIRLAEQNVENDLPIPALIHIMKAVDTAPLPEKLLLEYGQLAVEEQHRTSLKKITAVMEEQELPVPEQFRQFLDTPVESREMLKGTVTVLVDRGMRLERGVGYPDKVIGSGFFIDRRGYIITNYHVISSEVDPEYEGYSRLFVSLSGEGEEKIPAKVVGYDKIFDIALLKTEVRSPFVFSLEEQEEFSPGEKIFAIGSPGGLKNTITSGVISATGRRFLQMGDALQVDVPINPGNSGGPLLNQEGETIGVVFAGIEQYEGVNFAIPSHWVNDILPALYRGGEVTHSWLGTSLFQKNEELEILYSVPGEPAKRAGLHNGDTLLSINGKTYTEIREVQQFLLSLTPQSLITVSWSKDGEDEEHRGLVSLQERPFYPMDVARRRDRKENLFIPLFGFKIEETGRLFWGNNYIVKKVYPGSIADETGISQNDPLTIVKWVVHEEERIAVLQIYIKKRKAGFMQKAMQMASYLELDYFI
jgi:S1-C subfamily serine protease